MNKHRNNLLATMQLCMALSSTILVAVSAHAQMPATANNIEAM